MTQRPLALLLLTGLALLAHPVRAQEEVEAPGDDIAPPPPPEDEGAPQQTQQPQVSAPPSQEPTQDQFNETLSPYGHWVDTPEYGRVWVPNNTGADWQPYTEGQWVDTQYGWSFASTAPWGWAVYHYGRWGWRAGLGWYWVPGYHWGPAWVAWRHSNGYAAWSPLGPRGYVYPHGWPGWVAVPHNAFARPILRYRVPPARVGVIVRGARPVRGFGSVRYGGAVRVAPAHPLVRPAHKH